VKLVIAPDKFAGTLTAGQAARALAAGWRSIRPDDELDLVPMSDGGPGFCEVLADALPTAREIVVTTTDPFGRATPAVLLFAGDTAYVESAQAVGLHLLREAERDPEKASSAGLAVLLAAAVDAGARTIVVGLGGSATNDGGRGMVDALREGTRSGRFSADTLRALRDVDLVIASDVANPLLGPAGASAVFGPQKGASREAVARLEGRMQEWVRELPGLGDVASEPGAGAAGGLGAAFLWLGARREPGAALVAALLGLDAQIEVADLVITGEGSYDSTSLRNKVVATVASAAQQTALPCLVVAGQVSVGRREAAAHGVDEAIALEDLAGSVAAAMANARSWVTAAAAQLAGRWGSA
jgi:glycerate kinase